MITYLKDEAVESIVGGLDVTFEKNDTVVHAPDAALPGLMNAIGSVLVRGGHSIANLNIGPTLPFDAGEQGIYK